MFQLLSASMADNLNALVHLPAGCFIDDELADMAIEQHGEALMALLSETAWMRETGVYAKARAAQIPLTPQWVTYSLTRLAALGDVELDVRLGAKPSQRRWRLPS